MSRMFLSKRDLGHCAGVSSSVVCQWIARDKENQLCLKRPELLENTHWRYQMRLESLKNLALITAAGAAQASPMLVSKPASQLLKCSISLRRLSVRRAPSPATNGR